MQNEAPGRFPCANLCSKEMFYKDPDERPSEHEEAVKRAYGDWDTRAFWCQCTQRERGPDDRPVNPGECSRAGRSCYEGVPSFGERP